MGSVMNLKPAVTKRSEEMAYLDPKQLYRFPLKTKKSSTVTHFLSVSQSSVLRHDLGKQKRNLGWDHCLYIEINEEEEQLIYIFMKQY
jgi:hypothetical protein